MPAEPLSEVRLEQAPPPKPRGARSLVVMILRLLLSVAVLFAVVAFIAGRFRPELEALGRSFVERFGVLGMAFGTFIADGFHFPVPPQFYMLIAIAGGESPVLPMVAITIGSLLGGTAGFLFAGRVARFPRIEQWLAKSSHRAAELFSRFGYRAVLLATVLPVAYSMLCYLAGIYRLPVKVFALLCVLRIPRLIAFYYLIRLGWFASM